MSREYLLWGFLVLGSFVGLLVAGVKTIHFAFTPEQIDPDRNTMVITKDPTD